MTYRDLIVLLPCHSLEDFPMDCDGDDADGLLAAWTALWHPALLTATGTAPNWHHAAYPPEDLSDCLVLIPEVSRTQLPTELLDTARNAGATVIDGNLDRDAILQRALDRLEPTSGAADDDLAADFLALGYCYLQVELLTRQMRYATNLDELHFYQLAIDGAEAWSQANHDLARQKLVACFDLLAEERDHYYAVDAFIMDLVMVAKSTVGAPLTSLLRSEVPINVLLTADLADYLQTHDLASFKLLQEGIEAGRIGLVGGEQHESFAPLVSCESLLRGLQRGCHALSTQLGAAPQVYGRRCFGMTPLHPQLLNQRGFDGVLHATADGGRFPEGSQAKLRWEGADLTTIDSVARPPMDAARPETFLGYASKLGETMDMDHIATMYLAHWPGHESRWYADLRRIARYGGVLGKFVTGDQYFRDSDYATQLERFQADHYSSPYLVQMGKRGDQDPISRFVRYWQRRTKLDATAALLTAASTVHGRVPQDCHTAPALADNVDALLMTPDGTAGNQLDQDIDTGLATAVKYLVDQIPRGSGPNNSAVVTVNPYSTVRRAGVDWTALPSLPAIEKPVYAAAESKDRRVGVVDVPPMGFVWVQGGGSASAHRTSDPPLAEADRLRNEFFEARFDRTTGTLRGLYSYAARGNRLSQQVALRMGHGNRGGAQSGYTIMAADNVRVTHRSRAMAELTTSGRLVTQAGKTAATFQQRYQVWRGSRVLRVAVDLDPQMSPGESPWDSYYACRFAWPSEAAIVWRGLNQQRHRGEAKRLEAPLYIDLDEGKHHTTLFTSGLPFHRRTGPRMLDSLLIVAGERARHFELGIGIDVKYPLQESLAMLCPLPSVPVDGPPPASNASGWLFHLDCRNVVATYWEPLIEDDHVIGFRTRLIESMGRPANAKLSALRAIRSAHRCTLAGDTTDELTVIDGAVQVAIEANQWVEVEARW